MTPGFVLKYALLAMVAAIIAMALASLKQETSKFASSMAVVFLSVGVLAGLAAMWAAGWWVWRFLFSDKSYFIVSGIFLGLGALTMLMIVSMVKSASKGGRDISKMEAPQLLNSSVSISKIESDFMQMDFEAFTMHKISRKDLSSAQMLVDGKIVETSPFEENDGRVYVQVVSQDEWTSGYVFVDNKIYEVKNGYKANKLYEWIDKPFDSVRSATQVNERIIIFEGDKMTKGYSQSSIWQINLRDFSLVKLSDDPYYTHSMPPVSFNFGSIQVAVVYEGSMSWNFAGYSSNPQYSNVRLYSDKFPNGENIAKLSKKTGDVIGVQFDDALNRLILACDPNRESMETTETYTPIQHYALSLGALLH